jgi:hypothetical protein
MCVLGFGAWRIRGPQKSTGVLLALRGADMLRPFRASIITDADPEHCDIGSPLVAATHSYWQSERSGPIPIKTGQGRTQSFWSATRL